MPAKDKEKVAETKQDIVEAAKETFENKEISVRADTSEITNVTPQATMDVEGLEDVPMNMVPLPIVKLVHPTTKDAKDKDGKPVPMGYYLDTQSKVAYEQYEFYILRAKPIKMQFKDPKTGEPQAPKDTFLVLGAEKTTKKVFMMRIAGGGFWNFRGLLGVIKGSGMKAVWEASVIASSEEREGDYGTYRSPIFSLGSKASEDEMAELRSIYEQYGASLNGPGDNHEEAESQDDDIPF